MARPRSEEAREKMLRATAEIVFSDGVNAVTFDEVARRSGVAKTTIYRHFESKNEMLIYALDGATPFPELPDTGTLRQDLIDFYGSLQPIFRNEELRAAALDIMTAAARDPELSKLHQRVVHDRTGAMGTIFERAVARGELPDSLKAAMYAATEKFLSTEEGKLLFDDIYGWTAIRPAEDSDFDVVRDAAEKLGVTED